MSSRGGRRSSDRERGRDPGLYYLRVFGDPTGDSPWSWRFGGHHVSINHLIVDGDVAASTPCFLGADPASSPLLGPHPLRPLAGAEDLARELVHSLDDAQRNAAIVSFVAADRSGRRATGPHVSEGDLPAPLIDVWRARFEGELGDRMRAMQDRAEREVGLRAEHLEAVRFSTAPKGLPASALTHDQRELLRAAARRLRPPDPRRTGRRRGCEVRRPTDRSAHVRVGRRHRSQPAALLPDPRPPAGRRVRQHPARREPRSLRVARPRRRLRRRRARPPLSASSAPTRPQLTSKQGWFASDFCPRAVPGNAAGARGDARRGAGSPEPSTVPRKHVEFTVPDYNEDESRQSKFGLFQDSDHAGQGPTY